MPDIAHSHRLRTGRFSEHGRIYLVTSKTLHRRPVFQDWRLGRLLVNEMKQVHEEGLVSSLAWVIMPDHCHWLFELKRGSLASLMRRVKSRSGIAVNKALGNEGRFWQLGYHDAAIRHDDYLKMFARYIVANPLRAGLVERVGDYPLWDAVWL
ncbi:MAG: transposase [Pseudomonas sp.]|nr:transposase [Pseudomonas sp.]